MSWSVAPCVLFPLSLAGQKQDADFESWRKTVPNISDPQYTVTMDRSRFDVKEASAETGPLVGQPSC